MEREESTNAPPTGSTASQHKTERRTKAMWNAGISAINAFLETDEDYTTCRGKEEFMSCVRELLDSAESMAEALREPLKQEGRAINGYHLKLQEHARMGLDDAAPEERIKSLAYDLMQEMLKRNRMEEELETHRADATDVLEEVMQENGELKALLRQGSIDDSRPPAAPAKSAGPRRIYTKRKLDDSTFSRANALDRIQVIHPNGSMPLLCEYPQLQSRVQLQVRQLTSEALYNNHSQCRGLWQCMFSHQNSNAGVFRDLDGSPTEACTKCVPARHFCFAFRCGCAPADAETRLLPLPEQLRHDALSADVAFFKQGA
ncbi:hypothetical protein DOTSEDRAFT_71211 [Dothistroma septosporum NZE10]|uniref:Uncharacterized protein n=1 Tax=Dothistroma septosporum (strain NZE10 / CBS 128990) TaxID=675120 RepID=N1PSR4_DOTSN|nr:hypothetical protein DOTSEDRAFT_71211 [Dothistroma septosporum NZE10]